MESDGEVCTGSIPPANHVSKREDESLNPEAEDDLYPKQDLPNHVTGHEMVPQDALPRDDSAQTDLLCGEHKDREMELREAQDRIEKLQGVIADAERKLAESQKKHLEEVSSLRAELENSSLTGQDKVEALESEAARLVEELNGTSSEVSDLKMHLQMAKQDHGELLGQVDDLRQKVSVLEGQLEDCDLKAKKVEESFAAQFESSHKEIKNQEEVAKRALDECSMLKNSLEVAEASAREAEQAVKNLESEAQKTHDQILQNNEAQTLLEEAKVDKSKIEEENRLMREQLSQLEAQLDDEKSRAADLEGKIQNAEAELKATQGMAATVTEQLKVAQECSEKANGEVLSLQNVLKSTEEKLRISQEAADSLQVTVTNLEVREEKSAERLKEVEDGLQKMQLELHSKLESSEGNFKSLVAQLEEKAGQLQEALAAATNEGEGARKKLTDLELELDSLRHVQGELEEKLRLSEDSCSHHENSAHTFRTRGLELEGLITEHKTRADDANGKVASLEATLLEAQNKAGDLETKLKLAEENHLLLENRSGTQIAEFERCTKEYEAKVMELEMACAGAKSIEQDLLTKLHSADRMLEESQTEVKNGSLRISELELSVEAMELELKGALKREKLAVDERASTEEKISKLEALKAQLEGERGEFEMQLQQHAALVEKGKIDLYEASVQEGKLKNEVSFLQAAKAELEDLLSQLEMEKQTVVAQLDGTQKSFAELNEQLVEERQQLQQQIATIMQENGDLAQKFVTTQETLHATLAAAELSAKHVREGSLKESTLHAQIKDLNLQLREALETCTHIETLQQTNEKLEKALKVAITTEEHQMQMDQLLANSRLAESKVADLEEQLSKSQVEILKVQKAFDDRETHVKDLESKTRKMVEVVDEQPSGTTTTREIELDLQRSPGKARNRKKKGVTWEEDGNGTLKTRAVGKPDHAPAVHNVNQYVVHILIAVVCLLMGFWMSRKIHL